MSILLFLSICQLAVSQETASPPIVFIVDASGSMWQKVEAEYKIEIAREVLGDLVGGLPEKQSFGLFAYGHREKGNCDDIEKVLPTGNSDKAAFHQAMADLNPLGMTPLAASAALVIDDLKNEGVSGTIILITDGAETCEGDLCEVVEQAKEAGLDFVMHIIGFGLGDQDRIPLECAARAADGLYIDADDKDQLAEALNQTTELTVDIPKGRLSAMSQRNGELADASIVVYESGTEKEVASLRSYTDPETNPVIFNLPAGTYKVVATVVGQRGMDPIQKSGVVVLEEETRELVFDFSSGYFEMLVTENGALHDALVSVRRMNEQKAFNSGRTYASSDHNPLKMELDPGQYNITVKSVSIEGKGNEAVFENVMIRPGEVTELSHAFSSATLLVGAELKGQLCDALVNIISLPERKRVARGRTYTRADSNPKAFLLSPGEYEVEVKALRTEGDPREKFTINLKPEGQVEKIIKWQ